MPEQEFDKLLTRMTEQEFERLLTHKCPNRDVFLFDNPIRYETGWICLNCGDQKILDFNLVLNRMILDKWQDLCLTVEGRVGIGKLASGCALIMKEQQHD